jgi:hypothetical protein
LSTKYDVVVVGGGPGGYLQQSKLLSLDWRSPFHRRLEVSTHCLIVWMLDKLDRLHRVQRNTRWYLSECRLHSVQSVAAFIAFVWAREGGCLSSRTTFPSIWRKWWPTKRRLWRDWLAESSIYSRNIRWHANLLHTYIHTYLLTYLHTNVRTYIHIYIYAYAWIIWPRIFTDTYLHANLQYLQYQVGYVKGFGKLSGPETIEVALNADGSQTVSAKHIILAVG